jgi:ribosomal protein L40E
MICRHCGTEIAAKALICYRCGQATTDPKVKPPTEGSIFEKRRRSPLPWLVAAALAAAAAAAWWLLGG